MEQQKFKNIAKISLVALAGLVVAPFIFMAIKGLVGLGIAALVGSAMMAVAPAASQWLANMKYKALGAVISYEPVLTLKTLGEERWNELASQKDILEEQAANIALFKQKANRFIKDFPEEAEEWKQRVQDYEQIFAYRVEMWKDARAKTQTFMRTVDKAEAIYEMAVEDAKLGKSFGKNKDFMSVFKEKTAFDAIEKENSRAMASLKMALTDESFVAEQIKQKESPVHAVTYNPSGQINLEKLLDIQDMAPENVRLKATN